MTDWPILSTVTFLPLVGAALILFIRDEDDGAPHATSCTIALVDDGRHLRRLAADLVRASTLPNPGFQFVEKIDWLGGWHHLPHGRRRHLDAVRHPDDLPDAVLHPRELGLDRQARLKEYMIAFLVLETLMIGVFCALDLVLFYVFFEGGLIPMFLIIGVWGGKRRVYASFKFFLYTLLGSVLMLLAIMAMYWQAGTTDIPTLLTHHVPGRDADLAVARLLRLLRGEDADVAGPHLAARRACRGADRRLGHPGRDPPEDGRLRLPALLAADVPARLAPTSRRSSSRCRSSRSSTPRWSR